MRKIIICLSLALILISSAACGDNQSAAEDGNINVPAETNGQNDETQDPAVQEEINQEEIKMLPDIPEDLDFEGYKFRAFYSSVEEAGVWGLRDIVHDEMEQGAEVINDAVYMRNLYLEEKYNFEIVGIPTTTTTMQSSAIRRVIQSGSDEYDVLFVRQNQTADLITTGCLVDLNEVMYLDFDKPWWDKSIIDQLSVVNKIFAASGDIMATNSNALRVFLFNKQMIADFALDSPYDLVRENKWTLDTFYDMCKDASRDVNGDGIFDQHDQYGYLVQSGSTIKLFYSAGEHTIIKDSSGNPSLTAGNEKTMQTLEKIINILSHRDAVMFDGDYIGLDDRGPEYVLMTTFEDGRGLFFSEVLQLAERMRETDTDFGILPPPKADENQADYISFADSWCMNLMLVPVTNTNLERTGAILEAMGAESKYGLLPAYYEKKLLGKYARDDDSEEMLDIIIKNKIVSLDEMFNWALHGEIQSVLRSRSSNFASAIKERRNARRQEWKEP